MKIGVIGAGAWGLPSALELRMRGHEVTLIDRDVPGGELSSSRGTTRLWRLADPRPEVGAVLGPAVEAMDRLGERLGVTLYNRNGLVWRDEGSLDSTTRTLDATATPYERVPSDRVGEVFPGMVDDGRDALFIPGAGAVYAACLLDRAIAAFTAAGGVFLPRTRVREIHGGTSSAELVDDGGDRHRFDQLVIAAGPGSFSLLHQVGVDIPLRSYLEQVVHFGAPDAPDALAGAPCVFDGPHGDHAGIYGMPSPGWGYKFGLDRPLRVVDEDDGDRAPRAAPTRELLARVRSGFPGIVPHVLKEQVCVWTDSPDGKFIIDRVGPAIVTACGDSGEGFKFAAYVGELVADLVEGAPRGGGEAFRLDRHDWARTSVREVPTAMGQL